MDETRNGGTPSTDGQVTGAARRQARRASASDRKARLSVMLLFFLMGMTLGNWESRVPAIRQAVNVTDATWGAAYTTAIIGQLVSLATLAVLIRRVKTRTLSLVAAIVILIDAPLLAGSSVLAALVAGLFIWGFADNMLSTPSNSQAIEVERRYGRPLMTSFHATFSVGMLAGGGLGIAAADLGLGPGPQMAASSVVLAIALLISWAWQPAVAPPPPDEKASRRKLRATFTPQLVLLAAIAFLIAFTENGSAQWAALYATQGLGATAALGAATYTALSAAAFASRVVGDRIMGRFGRVRFLQLWAWLPEPRWVPRWSSAPPRPRSWASPSSGSARLAFTRQSSASRATRTA
jgi:fucose permease